MWVPSPHWLGINPLLYVEGFYQVDIGGQSLRWEQSSKGVRLAWVDDDTQTWLLTDFMPMLTHQDNKELKRLWQELQLEMCEYLDVGQMYCLTMDDGWGEITLIEVERALLSDPQLSMDDDGFKRARFLLKEYPVLSAKVSQFKDRLIVSAMCIR